MCHLLQTPRLRLRSCELSDLTVVHALWINEQIRRFLFDNRAISVDEARGFIQASLASFQQDGYGLWLLFAGVSENLTEAANAAANADTLIGFAGAIRSEAGIPSLIYGIAPAFWGHGYATEACRAVLDYLLANGFKVIADVDEPNTASVRVLQKLGMTQTGRAVVKGQPLLFFEQSGNERTKPDQTEV